jgi:hypothetical protein
MKTALSNDEVRRSEKNGLDSFLYFVGLGFGTSLFVAGIVIIIWLASFDFGNAFPED